MRAQGEDPQGGRKGLHTNHPPHMYLTCDAGAQGEDPQGDRKGLHGERGVSPSSQARQRKPPGRPQGSPPHSSTSPALTMTTDEPALRVGGRARSLSKNGQVSLLLLLAIGRIK